MNPDRGLGVKSIDVLVVLGPHIEKRILPLSANRTCQKLTIFWQIYWDCKNQTCNVTIYVIDDGRSNYSSISSDYIILTENISQKLGTADNHGQKVKDNLVDAKSKDNILATLLLLIIISTQLQLFALKDFNSCMPKNRQLWKSSICRQR